MTRPTDDELEIPAFLKRGRDERPAPIPLGGLPSNVELVSREQRADTVPPEAEGILAELAERKRNRDATRIARLKDGIARKRGDLKGKVWNFNTGQWVEPGQERNRKVVFATDLDQGATQMLSISTELPKFGRPAHAARAAVSHLQKVGIIDPQKGIHFDVIHLPTEGKYSWEPKMAQIDPNRVHSIKSNARRAAKKLGLDPANVTKVDGGYALGLTGIQRQYQKNSEAPAKEKPAPKAKVAKAPKAPKVAKAGKRAKVERKAAGKGKTPAKAPKQPKAAKTGEVKAFREGSKGAAVLALLQRVGGATNAQIQAATDWQAHTIRGFIGGTLHVKRGLNVVASKNEAGERVYTIPA